MMDTGLGPLLQGWECKIDGTRTGRLFYINHTEKSTTWLDPRLIPISPPTYEMAILQPATYFEDISGSRWSSPVPSLKAFNRRGSSPLLGGRLGGSWKICPSPTLPRRSEQKIVLESSSKPQAFEPPTLLQTDPNQIVTITELVNEINVNNLASSTTNNNSAPGDQKENERPQSAKSFSSSSYCGIPNTYLTSCDTETAYRTVCAVFPTAPEPHVRHLFHKYHNRATLVISALQVEKYPLASEKFGDDLSNADSKSIGINSPQKISSYATESPSRTGTGTPVSILKYSNTGNRSSLGSLSANRWGSPLLSLSPQLHAVKEGKFKSPKMKLKYMKGIFPAADETFLLDVLSSCDNNVQKASEKLLRKGFSKTPPAKPARHKWLEVKSMIERRNRVIDEHRMANQFNFAPPPPPTEQKESPFPTPIMKSHKPHISVEEKLESRSKLKKKFPKLPERFVSWAFEAAKFNYDKAERLLREENPQTPDEFKSFIEASTDTHDSKQSSEQVVVVSIADVGLENIVNLKKSKSKHLIIGTRGSPDKEKAKSPDSGYFEIISKPKKKNFFSNIFGTKTDYLSAKGPDSSLAKGSNPTLRHHSASQYKGPSFLSKGADPKLRQASQTRAQGPNPSLAKGSMWSSRNNNNNNINKPSYQVTVEG